MTKRPMALDTSPEAERMQIEGWRRMTPSQKAAAVTAMTTATIEMAEAGIRHRFPHDSPQLQRRRLADVLLGPDLAERAFGPLAE